MKSFVIFLLLNNENRVSRHGKKLGPLSMELDKEEMMALSEKGKMNKLAI